MVSITDKDKKWLLTSFKVNSYGKVMRGNIIHEYLYAEKVLKGYDKIKRRGCGCEHGGVKTQVDRLFKEWLAQEIT